MSNAVLALDAVGFTYAAAAGSQSVFDGMDAAFEAGRLTVIAGPSGSGKSTLLRIVAGLVAPTRGTVVHAGLPVGRSAAARRRYRRASVAYVFQRPADNTFHALRLEDNVRAVARARGVKADPRAVLGTVGLADRIAAYPGQLSGGEQQRVAVALGTIGGRAVLAADEPTAQVDASAAGAVVAALIAARDTGAAVVVASHDHLLIDRADAIVDLGVSRLGG